LIVVDASALLEVLLQTSAAARISQRIFTGRETICAPHLIDVELAQVVRRYVREHAITVDRGGEALDDLAQLPIHRYPHDVLLPRMWELRHNFTAYDAAYLALAEALDTPLITRDRALGSAGSRATVEVF
jgi:predicted nucleic acid-binding protein